MTYRQRLILFCIGVLLLVSCTPSDFVQTDGSIAFDIQIRIAAPRATSTLPSNATLSPTFTPTRAITIAPTFTPQPTQTVAPTDDPTPTIEFATSQPMEIGYVTIWRLNVRASAGIDKPISTVRGYISEGMQVEILVRSQVGDVLWYQVALPPDSSPIGWVSSQYIELDHG